MVVRGRVTACVHEVHEAVNRVLLPEVPLDELRPLIAHFGGYLRVTVPRKIDEKEPIVHREKVDCAGLPRGRGDARDLLARSPEQRVDQRRLPHVRPAREGDLWKGARSWAVGLGNRARVFNRFDFHPCGSGISKPVPGVA